MTAKTIGAVSAAALVWLLAGCASPTPVPASVEIVAGAGTSRATGSVTWSGQPGSLNVYGKSSGALLPGQTVTVTAAATGDRNALGVELPAWPQCRIRDNTGTVVVEQVGRTETTCSWAAPG